jgi:hypothetical protein
MRTVYTIFALLTFIIIIILSCSKGKTGPDPGVCNTVTTKNFANDVNPIIQTFCNQAACHDPGSSNGPGQLTNYTEIFNARLAIKGQVQAGLMPQNTTLTTAQKNTIICWIDSGAPNN